MPAKVNVGLAIGPRRADGFHDLQTVFAAVDLFDTITVTPAVQTSLRVTGPAAAGVPTDHTNLAWRAADRLGLPVAITVDKQIPVAAGLAGGSADAAGTLLAVSRLRPGPALAPIAAGLGSDVSFALRGGLALGEGRGELLQPLDGPPLHWVLAAAEGGLSTPDVYAELDRARPAAVAPKLDERLLAAVAGGDPAALAPLLHNDLQPAAVSLAPHLNDTLAAGARAGALAGLVSGSGPTCVFLAADRADAVRLEAALGPHCRFARAVVSGVRPTVESLVVA